jgi:translation initiation factor IF-2
MKEFGYSRKEVLHELEEMELEYKSVQSEISEDLLELVKEHFKDLVEQKQSSQKSKDTKTDENLKEIHLKPPVVVKKLAEAIEKKPNEIISELMKKNIMASINNNIDSNIAIEICKNFGFNLLLDKRAKQEQQSSGKQTEPEEIEFKDNPKDLIEKPPIVTFLGHVDHGKTSLQDKIRETNIVSGESGGITQHIGASTVKKHGKQITFIDTPGHEAFTAMRARGANITDIAVLVVAADDGFMPQTVEALNHAKAAGVPIIVAVNKIDLPGVNPDKVLLEMQQNNLMSEDWGGDVGVVRVSAITGEGIDALLERILLEAELMELKANPQRPGEAVVIESQVEHGLGATASILVMNGTINKGDMILSGEFFGKIKAMFDEFGKPVKKAGPACPVKIVGLSGPPEAGAKLVVCKNEKEVKKIAENRSIQKKLDSQDRKTVSLEDLFSNIEHEKRNRLPVIIKADVRGSIEAIQDSLTKIPSDKITVETIHSGVGAITENDVVLAAASGAMIIGFHVRVNPGVNKLAKQEKVEIRLYSVIYELLEDIREALVGQLKPEEREKELGTAKILQIFETSKGPNVIGCMVENGTVKVNAKARVYRDDELIFNGTVTSLRRFQDDVKEVKAGLECGIRLDNFADFHEGDKVQFYEIEYKKAQL